jgi:hypothetical protein
MLEIKAEASGNPFLRQRERGLGNFQSTFRPLLHDFNGAALAYLGAPRQEQGPKGVNCVPFPAYDSAHVIRMQTQFIDRQSISIDRCHGHHFRMFYQTFDDVFQKVFHTPSLRLSGGRRSGCFAQETGHRITRLRAFRYPVASPLGVHYNIVALFQRVIGADFLDELAISRTAAVGHHDPEDGFVKRSDPL